MYPQEGTKGSKLTSPDLSAYIDLINEEQCPAFIRQYRSKQ